MKVRIEETGEIFESGICGSCGQRIGDSELCFECQDHNIDTQIEREIDEYIEENESAIEK